MKVLLIIYLISIVYFLISFILLTAIITRRAKEEGLKFEKVGAAETIQTALHIILIAAVPILNLVAGSILLFSDTIQDSVMKKMREKSI